MLSTLDWDFQFQTFGEPELERALSEAGRFCAEMAQGMRGRWLSLLGQPGTGKTHLARRISAFFDAQLDGRLIPNQDINRTRWRMRGAFANWRKVSKGLKSGDWRAASDLETPYFVALDDIGADHATRHGLSELENLLDARMGKWTVITSNFMLEQLAELDSRVSSRMLRGGNTVVHVRKAEDYGIRTLANAPTLCP